MLFFMMAKSWVSAQDMGIELVREINQEVKQLEFNFILNKKFSVTVLIKHSSNNKLEYGYDKQVKLGFKGVKAFFVVMNFAEDKSAQFATISKSQNPCFKVVEIDVVNREETEEDEGDDSQREFDWDAVELDSWDLFEDAPLEDDYLAEKRKGGRNSYQRYQPLREKTKELCKIEIKKKRPQSALQLCLAVSKQIEENHPHLLSDFVPYQKVANDGGDWLRPTFYDWCNEVFKQNQGEL